MTNEVILQETSYTPPGVYTMHDNSNKDVVLITLSNLNIDPATSPNDPIRVEAEVEIGTPLEPDPEDPCIVGLWFDSVLQYNIEVLPGMRKITLVVTTPTDTIEFGLLASTKAQAWNIGSRSLKVIQEDNP